MEYVLNTGEKLSLSKIILDLNGTLAVHGEIIPGVKPRIKKLQKIGFEIFIITGDGRGNAKKVSKELGIKTIIATTSKEKAKALKEIQPKECIVVGNARIDAGMCKLASISILTLQAEGIHTKAIQYADIIIPSIIDALDLFIDKQNFLATMKA